MGQHFGFPWFGGGSGRNTEYADQEFPVEVTHSASETIAHAADLGMRFYTSKQFLDEIAENACTPSTRISAA